MTYYNEHDPQKAAWLRELMRVGMIAEGDVDERSIADVQPADLKGYRRCHFFAGIGVWDYALRLAGWPDDEPVWTGSCPCPSFSAAGKGKGFDDPRHLWPEWFRLIRECQPATIFGEQVDAAIGYGWLDLVSADLEMEGYAVGAAVLGACSVGAPHRRQRLWFVADAERGRCEQRYTSQRTVSEFDTNGATDVLGESAGAGRQGLADRRSDGNEERAPAERVGCAIGRMEYPFGERREWGQAPTRRYDDNGPTSEWAEGKHGAGFTGSYRDRHGGPGPVNGVWRDADWIRCRDGKWRPVESGTFPLAHGAAARVGRLRGYGDGIVAQVAAEWIGSYMDVAPFR